MKDVKAAAFHKFQGMKKIIDFELRKAEIESLMHQPECPMQDFLEFQEERAALSSFLYNQKGGAR